MKSDAEHGGMGPGSLSLVGVRNQHKQGFLLEDKEEKSQLSTLSGWVFRK